MNPYEGQKNTTSNTNTSSGQQPTVESISQAAHLVGQVMAPPAQQPQQMNQTAQTGVDNSANMNNLLQQMVANQQQQQ